MQLLALHTTVRDLKTPNAEFVFYADRIIRLLIEEALETLPYIDKVRRRSSTIHRLVALQEKYSFETSAFLILDKNCNRVFFQTIITPSGHAYAGTALDGGMCGVAMIRSGESMEHALRAVVRDVPIGKLLVRKSDEGCSVMYCKVWRLRLPDYLLSP